MSKIKLDGKVIEALPNTQFLVELDDKQIRCYLSGKMRINNITVLPGDKVIVELESNLAIINQIGRIIRRK